MFTRRWLNASEDNVYIGRRMQFVDGASQSKWHNPFHSMKLGRDEAVIKYEEYLETSGLIKDIEELRGKTMGCWS
jgi:hypothetical protein